MGSTDVPMKTDSQPDASSSKIPTDGPFAPPKDGRCIINELPTELLSHIFLLGFEEGVEGEEELESNIAGVKIWKRDYGDEDEDTEEEKIDEEKIPKDDGDSDYEDMDSDEEDDEDDGDDEYASSDESELETPWEVLITQVCHRWREVAIEIPQLWAQLDFGECPSMERLQLYMQRSKEAPLNLRLDWADEEVDPVDPEDIDMQPYIDILDLLEPHVRRLQSLEVMVNYWKQMSLVLKFFGRCPAAPMLEILQLYHYETEEGRLPSHEIPEEDRKQDFVLFHGNTPLLVDVALWGVHLDWEKSTFLRNLRSLELAYHQPSLRPSFKQFARMLKESPDLEILTISESGPQGDPVDWLQSVTGGGEDGATELDPATVTTTIELPRVKEFVLAFFEPPYAQQLMDRLVFTSLTSLTLDSEDGDDFTDFITSLARPHRVTGKSILCNLDFLALNGLGSCRQDVITEFLSQLHNVVTLRLNLDHVDLHWFFPLIPPAEARGGYLPRLQTLYIGGIPGAQTLELVKARRAAGIPLVHLFMNRIDELFKSEAKWLRSEASGLKTFELFEDSDDEDDIVEVDMDDDDVSLFDEWEDYEGEEDNMPETDYEEEDDYDEDGNYMF